MKYLILLSTLLLSGCYVAPYDPYYYGGYPAYGGYYGPVYAPQPAYVSVGYGGGGYYRGGYGRGHYGHRYWR